jgi:hypothetical protein
MSWSGGGEVFDKTVKSLIATNADWWATKQVAKTLLLALKRRGWEDEEGSLGLFYGQPGAGPIVEMFNELGYVAQGQYDSEGHSIIRVPCGYCGQLVFFYWDEDQGEVIETHVLDIDARPQVVCSYAGKGRTGH